MASRTTKITVKDNAATIPVMMYLFISLLFFYARAGVVEKQVIETDKAQ